MDAAEFKRLMGSTEGQTRPSQEINPSNLKQLISQTEPEPSMSWMDVPIQSITNIPKSAYQFGKGLYEAVTSPLQTTKSLLDIGAGTLRNITPKTIADLIDKIDKNPEAAQKASDVATQVGLFYKDRYGSSEGFKKALAQDPVGVASDISTVLSGGGALLRQPGAFATALGGGEPSRIAKLAAGLSRAGEVTNPIAATVQATKAVIPPILGVETGVGQEAIKRAYQAGTANEPGFLQQLRGNAPMTQPLENAKYNLEAMRQNRSKAYKSGMIDITGDKTILSLDDIENSFNKATESNRQAGVIRSKPTEEILQKVKGELDEWKSLDPAEHHTPEGLDALKQRVGDILQTLKPGTNEHRVVGQIYNSVKKSISDQAPTYSKVMKDYAEASDQLRQIESSLSLNDRASVDTALRKLQSLTRNNVYTNYGQRLNLAETLEAEGGRPFINEISGQALSSMTPRGLAQIGSTGIVGAAAALQNPAVLGLLPLQSPRAVGEVAYKAGQLGGPVRQFGQTVGVTPTKLNTLAELLNAQQQAQNNELFTLPQMVAPR